MKKFFIYSLTTIGIHFCYTHAHATYPSCSIEQSISEIKSLHEIANPSEITIYFFDIDDTLFDSPYMLGSKSWRKYIRSATQEDPSINWFDILSLFVAKHYPVATVEEDTAEFIKNIQEQGHIVFGLTARERKIWYDTVTEGIDQLTVEQLSFVGIFLDHPSQKNFPDWICHSEYFSGIFFADVLPKGVFLLQLFKNSTSCPKKVIFVDDKLEQVESVAAALEQLHLDFACYWYTLTDEKTKQFEPIIANIQLYYLWISDGTLILSDEEARLIQKQFPEKDADFYLEKIKNEVITELQF